VDGIVETPYIEVVRGGPGSGHHGHTGRPGLQGGSLPREGNSERGSWLNYYANKLRNTKRPEIKDGSDILWRAHEKFGVEREVFGRGDLSLHNESVLDFIADQIGEGVSIEYRYVPEMKDGNRIPRGFVVEDKNGNLLLANMYTEGWGTPNIRLPGLFALQKGTGLGTKFMNALKDFTNLMGASYLWI
jgi:hypothetical protein